MGVWEKGNVMVEQLVPQDFSGAVSVLHQGRPVFQKAYGYADLTNQIQNRIDTRFATASAGKAFVAVGIMNLVQEGQLSMDSVIGDLLSFDLKQIDPNVTVKQLLNHTSGVPDYFDETVMEDYAGLFWDYPNYRIRTSMDLLPLFISKPMMYSRGERFQYNNSGYVLLGLIIESVVKMPFDEYLQHTVFEPFSMDNTGYYALDRLSSRCANAYILDKDTGKYYTNIYSVDVKGTGAGGAFTTIQDIDLFWQHLFSGTLLFDKTFSEMISPQTAGAEYGYGFWLKDSGNGYRFPYFQGSDPGVSFVSSYDRKTDYGITLVSNFEQDVWEIHALIRNGLGC